MQKTQEYGIWSEIEGDFIAVQMYSPEEAMDEIWRIMDEDQSQNRADLSIREV